MDLTLNFVSSLCWEIILTQSVHIDCINLPIFKALLDAVYDIYPTVFENNLRIYWRYTQKGFLQINNYLSFCAFLRLMVEPNIYLIIEDAEKVYEDTDKFLKLLDLMELQRVKAMERNKYDLRCEADEIGEEIKRCQKLLTACSHSENRTHNDTDILKFALRKMPMGRCYTVDICSGYSLIDCVRKGWPKSKKILVPLPDEVIEKKNKKDKSKDKLKPDKTPNKKTTKNKPDKKK